MTVRIYFIKSVILHAHLSAWCPISGNYHVMLSIIYLELTVALFMGAKHDFCTVMTWLGFQVPIIKLLEGYINFHTHHIPKLCMNWVAEMLSLTLLQNDFIKCLFPCVTVRIVRCITWLGKQLVRQILSLEEM